MQTGKAERFGPTFAVNDLFLLRKAKTEQVSRVLSASTAVQVYAASNGHAGEWIFKLLRQKRVSLLFLNVSLVAAESFEDKERSRKRASFRSSF